MKLYSLFVLFTIPLLCINGDDPINYLGVKGPLKFNEKNFELVWSEKSDETRYVQEYLPEGETLEQFSEMLTLNLFITETSVNDAIQQRLNSLENNKSIILSNSNVTESPNGKEKILDCILSAKSTEVVEVAILYFKEIQLGNKKGLIVYSYSKRSYGDAIAGFLLNMKKERENLLNKMITTKFPKVNIDN